MGTIVGLLWSTAAESVSFFDYMDVNKQLLTQMGHSRKLFFGTKGPPSDSMLALSEMPVGVLANCSQLSAYVPIAAHQPLRDILNLLSGSSPSVRRCPVVDSQGNMLHVFTCLDTLKLLLRCAGPAAVLQSRAARTFDRRGSMMEISVQHDDAMLNALRIMDQEGSTICPVTSRELSGDMGGVVASGVVSVSDLKWVMSSGQFDILSQPVSEFINWRDCNVTANLTDRLRQERLRRFNVISVRAGDSLHMLAQRILESKLQRIFLSSEELARIVGIVSSRDILIEVLDQLR